MKTRLNPSPIEICHKRRGYTCSKMTKETRDSQYVILDVRDPLLKMRTDARNWQYEPKLDFATNVIWCRATSFRNSSVTNIVPKRSTKALELYL